MLGEFTGATNDGNVGPELLHKTFGTWWLDALEKDEWKYSKGTAI